MTNIKLSIEGMTCNGCANRVAKALREVPGVTAATVTLAEGAATVSCEPDTDPRQLADVVESKGYRARVTA